MGDDLVNWWLTILFKKKKGDDPTRVTSVGRQTCQLGHHWLAWPSVWIISTSICQKNGDILYTSSCPPDLLTTWLNRFDSEIEIPIYSRLDFEILLRQINVQINDVCKTPLWSCATLTARHMQQLCLHIVFTHSELVGRLPSNEKFDHTSLGRNNNISILNQFFGSLFF